MNQYFTKQLLYNLLIAAGIIFVLLMLTNGFLKVYTRHGQSITVPQLNGKKMNQAEAILNSADLDFKILDSAFRSDLPPNTIIDQTPKAGAKVKAGRTIFLTLNAFNPPMVEIPDLVGKSSYKYAKMQLESYGFVVGEPVFKPSPHINALLEIRAEGKLISPKGKLPKGTVLTLIVGQGISDEEVNIPYLIGLTYKDAMRKLTDEFSLSLGVAVVEDDVTDTLNAVIYRQSPEFREGGKVKIGEEFDIFVAKEMPAGISIREEFYSIGRGDTAVIDSVEEIK